MYFSYGRGHWRQWGNSRGSNGSRLQQGWGLFLHGLTITLLPEPTVLEPAHNDLNIQPSLGHELLLHFFGGIFLLAVVTGAIGSEVEAVEDTGGSGVSLFSLNLRFWNQRTMTLISSPVLAMSSSFISLEGYFSLSHFIG